MSESILQRIAEVLEARKQEDPEKSYVASLYQQGTDSILKKVAEESAETIMAAKDGEPSQIVYEVADLWFHSMILLAQQNIPADAVLQELERRFGVSGHEEKAARKK